MDSTNTGGMLHLVVVQANLTRDVETFGKQDPYVTIHYGGQKYKTKIMDGAGKTPVWNDAFDFHVGSVSDDLELFVKDDDVIGAKLIAQTHLKLSSLCINGGVREWFTVNYQDKSAGQVLLETKFVPTVSQSAAHAQPVPAPQGVPVVVVPQMAPPGYPPFYPPGVAGPQGAFPPGQYAPQYHQSSYPPQYPPGQYPPSSYPPGAYPPGSYNPGAYPSGGHPPSHPVGPSHGPHHPPGGHGSKNKGGVWKGYYMQNGSKHNMHFKKLTIGRHGDKVKGKGKDDIGKFKITGIYTVQSGDVIFKKAYKGKHTVEYFGVWHGSEINGEWMVGSAKGTFKLEQDYDTSSGSSGSDSD